MPTSIPPETPSIAKAVIDINLFVSGLMGSSLTRSLIQAWRDQQFMLVVSERLLTELIEVLNRPRLRRYFREHDVKELIALVLERAEFAAPTRHLSLCRDPKDNVLLDIAAESHSQFLVTGDKDLLDDPALIKLMKDEYGVRVVTSTEFLSAVGNKG